jgi:hypothetical protein
MRALTTGRRASWAAAALMLLPALFAPSARAQVVFDRTVATVNGELVTKSDLLWNLALDLDVPPAEFWKPETQALALRALVDARLLLQEAAKLPAAGVTEQEVTDEIARIAGRFTRADDPDRFTKRLALVGLTQERLRQLARERIQIEKFIDFRFGSFVVVSEEEIRRYYETEIAPKLRAGGQVPPAEPSAERREEARAALTREKVEAAIETYLEEARTRAEIVNFE